MLLRILFQKVNKIYVESYIYIDKIQINNFIIKRGYNLILDKIYPIIKRCLRFLWPKKALIRCLYFIDFKINVEKLNYEILFKILKSPFNLKREKKESLFSFINSTTKITDATK